MKSRTSTLLIALATAGLGCGENSPLPGIAPGAGNALVVDGDPDLEPSDDPAARMWRKAGSWYDGESKGLDKQMRQYLGEVDAPEPKPALGILTPHASLKASGSIAAEVYARVEMADVVILLSPKHYGDGEAFAIWNEGPWLVPGRELPIRNDLTDRLLEELGEHGLVADRAAFDGERSHPPEMQLPFLSRRSDSVSLVPLSFHDHSDAEFPSMDLEGIEATGQAIARLVEDLRADGEDVMIVATTDLVHKEPLTVSDVQDARLVELIAALDTQALHDYVVEDEVTICGEIPSAVFMVALRELGASDIEVVARGTSEHLSGEDSVVGYPGIIAWK